MPTAQFYADAQVAASGLANQLTNPANAVGSSEATNSASIGTTQNTDYANFFTFNATSLASTIPTGSTINSVTLRLRDALSTLARGDVGIRVDTTNGTPFEAENIAKTGLGTALPSAGTGAHTYTTTAVPTRTQLVAASFGVRVRYRRTASQAATYTLDWVRLEVDYTPPLTLTQTTFRGRNDDGDETSATWKGAAGADWTQPLDENFRVRFLISSSGAAPAFQTGFGIHYSRNGGAWSGGRIDGGSSMVRTSLSAWVTDGSSTTEQLGGSGRFNPGEFDETDGWDSGFVGGGALVGDETEIEICLQIRSADGVVAGDSIALRPQLITGTAPLDAYTDWPVINVAAPPAPPTLTQTTFRGRNDDGSEATATWKAAAGADWTQPLDENFRVRFNIASSTSPPNLNQALGLAFNKNNAGWQWRVAYAAWPEIMGSSSPNVTDQTPTTEQLGGAGAFNPGVVDTGGGFGVCWRNGTALNQDTEVEFCLQLRSGGLVPGDTLALRVMTVGTADEFLNGGYTDWPVITAAAPAPAAPTITTGRVSVF